MAVSTGTEVSTGMSVSTGMVVMAVCTGLVRKYQYGGAQVYNELH